VGCLLGLNIGQQYGCVSLIEVSSSLILRPIVIVFGDQKLGRGKTHSERVGYMLSPRSTRLEENNLVVPAVLK